jgi:hypothetical protein
MIFQYTCEQVMAGSKTNTRRLPGKYDVWDCDAYGEIHTVYTCHDGRKRIKWQVGKTYAVQRGRGQKQIGRIRLNAIQRERLQDIEYQDAMDEGVYAGDYWDEELMMYGAPDIIDLYAELWDSIHTDKGTRWEDNPMVWVLVFELVQKAVFA